MEHLDHMLSVAGPQHIGLGSDFDGFTAPYGVCMKSTMDIEKITDHLVEKGWKDDEIAMIMGGNWLRVMKEVIGK
jgi:membrane dipeptidase